MLPLIEKQDKISEEYSSINSNEGCRGNFESEIENYACPMCNFVTGDMTEINDHIDICLFNQNNNSPVKLDEASFIFEGKLEKPEMSARIGPSSKRRKGTIESYFKDTTKSLDTTGGCGKLQK
jgi:hypothetical protein